MRIFLIPLSIEFECPRTILIKQQQQQQHIFVIKKIEKKNYPRHGTLDPGLKCSAFDMEMIFHSHANETHFHRKGCSRGLILKVGVMELRSGLFSETFTK